MGVDFAAPFCQGIKKGYLILSDILNKIALSGRRDSNPPPTAWKAVALPDELLPRKKCGGGRIRTSEGESQQIYSLPHLTALEPPRCKEQCAVEIVRAKVGKIIICGSSFPVFLLLIF